jgi:transcription elongation factor GreA
LTSRGENLSLGEAAGRFLASLPAEDRGTSQQEIHKFVRWYGWERSFARLTAPDVANYAERLSQSDTDYLKKLDLIRAFLVYARKEGWRQDNLAIHLKARKGKTRATASVRKSKLESVKLTQQGYDELKAELAALQSRRPQIIDDMRRAAADKDFRENAPLDAAREQRGQLEGRIMELEEILSSAVIIDEKRKDTPRANIGDSIVLQDLTSGEELHYTLVNPKEVDPTKGKISGASPIGKATVGKRQGDFVEVTVPAGKLRYQIKQIER